MKVGDHLTDPSGHEWAVARVYDQSEYIDYELVGTEGTNGCLREYKKHDKNSKK